jgi:hypothetical protein
MQIISGDWRAVRFVCHLGVIDGLVFRLERVPALHIQSFAIPSKEQRFLQTAGLPPATVPSPLQQNRPVLLLDFSLIIQRGCQRTPVICPCHSYAFAPCTPLNRPVSRQACLLDQYPSDAVKLPGSCQSVASLAADFHLEKKSAWRLIISPKYASTNLCRLPSIYDVHHVQARMNRPLKVLPRPGFI